MSFEFTGSSIVPTGDTGLLETFENQFWFGKYERLVEVPMLLSGASRDVGNSGYTTVLRPGLLLGRVGSTKKLKEWDPTASDGSEVIYGILQIAQNTQRLGGNADRWMGYCIVGGNLKAERLLVPGSATLGISGNTYEYLIRAQLNRTGRFLLSDDLPGVTFGGWKRVIAKTADYAVLVGDNDTLFTNRGATGTVNFTLPATPYVGLRYGFYVAANQTLTITAGTADTLTAVNDLTADSISFGTTNLKIGGFIEVIGDGTSWLSIVHAAQTSDGTTSGQLVTIVS